MSDTLPASTRGGAALARAVDGVVDEELLALMAIAAALLLCARANFAAGVEVEFAVVPVLVIKRIRALEFARACSSASAVQSGQCQSFRRRIERWAQARQW